MVGRSGQSAGAPPSSGLPCPCREQRRKRLSALTSVVWREDHGIVHTCRPPIDPFHYFSVRSVTIFGGFGGFGGYEGPHAFQSVVTSITSKYVFKHTFRPRTRREVNIDLTGK